MVSRIFHLQAEAKDLKKALLEPQGHGFFSSGEKRSGFRSHEKYDLYPLVMTNIAIVFRWPIEIDGVPIKHGDFPWLC